MLTSRDQEDTDWNETADRRSKRLELWSPRFTLIGFFGVVK